MNTNMDFINQLIKSGLQRNEVFDMIPNNASKILDIGYGDGALLMRLKYQKKCTDLYGLEMRIKNELDDHLDGNWNIDLFDNDNEIFQKFNAYFEYIILHDVIEHIHNPWLFLQSVHQLLSTHGTCIIVTPNAQFWEVPYALLSGLFPYGAHGFWNEDHIRWYTMKSLVETAILSGFAVDKAILMYPERLSKFSKAFQMILQENKQEIEIPPMSWDASHLESHFPFTSPTLQGSLKIKVSTDANNIYPYLMAVKLIIKCKKSSSTQKFQLYPGSLTHYRKKFITETQAQKITTLFPNSVETILERR